MTKLVARAGLAGALVAGLAACAAEPAPQAQNVAEDFHLIEGGFSRGRGPDGNTEIFDAADGLVVIDTGRHPGHSALILDYAREKGKPVAAIINTHWHLDHTTGNTDVKREYPHAKVYATPAIEGALQGFLKRGAERSEKLLAENRDLTDKDRAEILRGLDTIAHPDALLPDIAVTGPMKIAVAGRTLELNVTDHATTAADIWIWDPATKTAIIGDLVTFPAPFLDTGCAEGWLAAFEAIEQKPYQRIAPGHGAIMTPAAFRQYQSAFRNLVSCARERTGAECAAGWVADAGALMSAEDREQAPAYVEYYVDNALKSASHAQEFCAG